MKILRLSNFILTITLLLSFGGQASAWIEPTTIPPGNNIFAPLNTSSFGQSKVGGLILNLGGAAYGLVVRHGLVGFGTDEPQAQLDVAGKIKSTGLKINSTTHGVLLPRTTPDKITNPTEGMIIFNTAEKKFYFFSGSSWTSIEEAVSDERKVVEYAVGEGRLDDYYCKKKNITADGMQEDWANINEGKLCGANDKVCQSGECKELSCGIDLYKTALTCSAVGTGYYSPANNNSRYNCTNKPVDSAYIGSGGGANNCPWSCNANYTQSGSSCVANTRTFSCSAKPASTDWNTVSSYTQTWNGSAWAPVDSPTAYNATGDTNSCRYKCASNYTWNGSSCVAAFVCGVTQVKDAENNAYDTILINGQCWLKQNMNIGTKLGSAGTMPNNNNIIEKWCYDNSDNNCKNYGGLYHWNEVMKYSNTEGAQGICPDGWHVPKDGEWHALENYLKDAGQSCDPNRRGYGCLSAGTKLKIGGGSGFDMPFAGIQYLNIFANLGKGAAFWSSSQSNSYPYYRSIDNLSYPYGATVYRNVIYRYNGYSVRCIKN